MRWKKNNPPPLILHSFPISLWPGFDLWSCKTTILSQNFVLYPFTVALLFFDKRKVWDFAITSAILCFRLWFRHNFRFFSYLAFAFAFKACHVLLLLMLSKYPKKLKFFKLFFNEIFTTKNFYRRHRRMLYFYDILNYVVKPANYTDKSGSVWVHQIMFHQFWIICLNSRRTLNADAKLRQLFIF